MIKYITLFIAFCWLLFSCTDNDYQEGRIITFKQQVGTYQLDIQKTDLSTYKPDSNFYKSVIITFNDDSTFILNKKVPFLYDSTGTWDAGNTLEWSYMYFKSFPYNNEKRDRGTQFTRPYSQGTDTFFLINSATPQNGANFIQHIYFKKIKRV